jgi:hypothetical protein
MKGDCYFDDSDGNEKRVCVPVFYKGGWRLETKVIDKDENDGDLVLDLYDNDDSDSASMSEANSDDAFTEIIFNNIGKSQTFSLEDFIDECDEEDIETQSPKSTSSSDNDSDRTDVDETSELSSSDSSDDDDLDSVEFCLSSSSDSDEEKDDDSTEGAHCYACVDDKGIFGPQAGTIAGLNADNYIDVKLSNKEKNLVKVLGKSENDMAMAVNFQDLGVYAPHVVEDTGSFLEPEDLLVFSNLKCGWINADGARIYGSGVIINPPTVTKKLKRISHISMVCCGEPCYPITFSDGQQIMVTFDNGKVLISKLSNAIGFTYRKCKDQYYSEFAHRIYVKGVHYDVLPYEAAGTSVGLYHVISDGFLYQWRDNKYIVLEVDDGEIITSDDKIVGSSDLDSGIYRFEFDSNGKLKFMNDIKPSDSVDSYAIFLNMSAQVPDSLFLTSETIDKPKTYSKNNFVKCVSRFFNGCSFDFDSFGKFLFKGNHAFDDKCMLHTLLMFGLSALDGFYYAHNFVATKWHCPRVRWARTSCLCKEKYFSIRRSGENNYNVDTNMTGLIKYYYDYDRGKPNKYYDHGPVDLEQ